MVSAPRPPSRVLAAALPVRLLFSSLPVPLTALPVSTRFSRLAPRRQSTDERTVSTSPARVLVSVTVSPRLSTM
ncbi:hypothetical protein C6Y56_24020 [Pseudomonas fluorescens]|uniref:Uncharacterized protein n=1 Tax=Pseudomonas fluorescens TaxID=294 RepID=A0A7Z3H1T1_PSEFL|nr:hypothetical protein C6Y56_24020 [Pseudomonas fluorescens]